MSSESKNPTAKIRLWPAIVIAILVIGLLLRVNLREVTDAQSRVLGNFGVLILGFCLGLLWLLLFSRLPWRTRLRATGLTLLGPVLFLALFRIEGVTGNFIPIIKWRFAGAQGFAQATGSLVDAAPTPDDFPQFLGPTRDGKVPTKLARDWQTQKPRELWRRKVGESWSGFAVVGQVAITQEQREGQEFVVAYDKRTGEPIWSHAGPGRFDSTIGGNGPRATPTVVDGQVFTMGPEGLLRALELETGKLLWSREAAKENQGRMPEWGFASSPLVFDDLVVVTVGGPSGRSLVAYRRQDGSPAWQAGDDRSGFSSPLLTELAGRRQIVIFNGTTIAGHEPETGKLLWTFPWSPKQPNVAQPLKVGPNLLLVSSGYGIGSQVLRFDPGETGIGVTSLWENRNLKAKFTNLVVADGKVYGLDDGILVCLDPQTGERCWKNGRYGHGQILLADDLLLLQTEDGEIVLIECNPQELRELGRFQAFSGKSWNSMALAGGQLIVRNNHEAASFELPLASGG